MTQDDRKHKRIESCQISLRHSQEWLAFQRRVGTAEIIQQCEKYVCGELDALWRAQGCKDA
jgi:hypothetical protein